MISKEKFVEYLKEFMKIRRVEDELNESLYKLCLNNNYIGLDRHDTLIINLLEESMNDKEHIISNYIYDTDNKKIPELEKIRKNNDYELLYDSIVKYYETR